jgi:hypothetical protein
VLAIFDIARFRQRVARSAPSTYLLASDCTTLEIPSIIKMSSQSPAPPAEVKLEEPPVQESDTPAREASQASPAPATGITKETCEVMNGIVRRLTEAHNNE